MPKLDWEGANRKDVQRATRHVNPTPRQISLLKKLCKERGMAYVHPLTKEDAATWIDGLLKMPRKPQAMGGPRRKKGPSRSTR